MNSKTVIKQSTITMLSLEIFFLTVILIWGSIYYMNLNIKAEQTAEMRRTQFKQLGLDLADASDYLTDEARKFAVTEDIVHLNKYWEEINITKTRDYVITRLQELDSPPEEAALLAEAKRNSDALVETERHSMRLVLEALGTAEKDMVPEVASFHLSDEDKRLSKQEKLAKARHIMFDQKYDEDKKIIMAPIAKFQSMMNSRLEAELEVARQSTQNAAKVQLILAFVSFCALGLLLSISHNQFNLPIKNYTTLLQDLTFSREKFSLTPQGSQELRMFADTFNQLYNSLQEELVKRKQAEQIMKAAKEEAELANKAKSEFLASMSHEIRTPLNAIIGYEHLLGNTELGDKQKEYLGKIRISAKNLLAIINDILDFSKIEAGRLTMECIEFDLYSIMQDICSLVRIEVQQKELELNYTIDDDVPRYMTGDPTRLKQVILNLVANGIKFTEKGSLNIHIVVVEKLNDHVELCFSVADTGIGISEEQKKFLFDAFTQADASTSRKFGGTGLGLAICKKIVEQMGGNIDVVSEVGKGSTFYFTGKFKTAQSIPLESNQINADVPIGVFKYYKILLVEDNEINREMTREILEGLGFYTDTAESGALAVMMVKQRRYDAVLMDIRMPEMDGYEATRCIRTFASADTLPIIALSADAVEGVAEEAKKAGMNDYTTKPLNAEKLVAILQVYIKPETDMEEFEGRDENKAECKDLIDFKGGIERMGGKKEKYKDILEMFIDNHNKDVEALKHFIASEDFEGAKRLVHTVKGIAANIGATSLSKVCERVETALDTKDPKEMTTSLQDFEEMLKEVTEDAHKFIISLSKQEHKEDPVLEIDNMEALLLNLEKMLRIGDSDAKELFNAYKPWLVQVLEKSQFDLLDQEIVSYNLEEAADRVIEIVDKVKKQASNIA